LTSRQS